MNAKTPSSQATVPSAQDFPVRDGEDPWTDEELSAVRTELLEEQTSLAEEIAEMASELDVLVSEGINVAGDDDADAGSKTIERDHEMALLGKTQDLQAQVGRALGRLADGSYGRCESCGEPIGKLRLQAIPRALLCLSCKQRQDRH